MVRATSMSKLRLVPIAGGAPIEVESNSVVGRDSSVCQVVIDDPSISRRHARLEKRGDVWAVVDEASANGTHVDAQRIVEAGLRHGQRLAFGKVGFQVEVAGADDDMQATRLGGIPFLRTPAGGTASQGRGPWLWVAGCCGCLVALAGLLGVLILFGAVTLPGLAGPHLRVEASPPTKTPDGGGTKVEITVGVTGYATRPSGGTYALDLEEDVETFGPTGMRVPGLSKQSIERRQTALGTKDAPAQTFVTTLTVDPENPHGRYKIRFTVTDHISGQTGTAEAPFELP